MKYANKSTLDDLQMIRQAYLDHFAKESNLTNVVSLANKMSSNEQSLKGAPFSFVNFVLRRAIGNTTTSEAPAVPTISPFALCD